MSKLSPLMEQYYQEKRLHPDALLLFRVGDFYETFAEDAVVVARDLNITLTSRQKDDQGARIPLAGVPYHSLDSYLPRLIRAGHKVAICDQVEDPKLAKGLVKRRITRVVTPGTIIEPTMLEESSNNFLAAVVREDRDDDHGDRSADRRADLESEHESKHESKHESDSKADSREDPKTDVDDEENEDERTGKKDGVASTESGRLGLAFIDVSTGEFLTTEILEGRLLSELARFRPAECISSFKLTVGDAKLQILDPSFFSMQEASKALAGRFGADWKKSLGLEERPLCTRACGAVLAYLHESHLDALGHLRAIRIYSGSEYMALDEVTLRNLEIARNIRERSKRATLLEYLDRTRTAMGARMLSRWIQMPLYNMDAIERRLDAVQELFESAVLRESISIELKGTSDLERLTSRITCGSAGPKELVVLKETIARLPGLKSALEVAGSKYLVELKAILSPLPEMLSLLERSIVEDPPTHLRDGGVIRTGYDPEIDELRSLLLDGRGWIARLEARERERTGIKSLKIAYNNVFGYYIEASRANLHLVPPDYIRKQTLANAERFITPELKEMESKVLSAQERLLSLEQELFSRLRDQLAVGAGEITKRATAIAELDVLISLAEAASEAGLVRPEFNLDGRITLRSCRHPVLDRAMRGSFVPNDVLLDCDTNRLMILTGPNMAGKSTFMRQIAISVIMAQAGSFVPASFASLPLVDRVFTRVGAYDDLSAGQSTFMVEMTEIATILDNAGRESLVLLDEVGRGTSTFDGLSLAWAISEFLHNSIRCKSVFATHYHQLTQLEGRLSGVKNYSIAVKEEKGEITFLRTVVPGATDKSYGVHVARLAGVPEAVTRRADQILKEIERQDTIEPLSGGKRQKRASRYTQLIFFDGPGSNERDERDKRGERDDRYEREEKSILAPARDDPVLEEIRSLEVESITPLQALGLLAEFKKRLALTGTGGSEVDDEENQASR